METTATPDLGQLFAQPLTDRASFHSLAQAAFANQESLNRFLELLAPLESKGAAEALKLGFCYMVLGDYTKASTWLEKASGPLASFYLGQTRLFQGRYKDAVSQFENAARQGADTLECRLHVAECFLMMGDPGSAQGILNDNQDSGSAHWNYVQGRLHQAAGNHEAAMDAYDGALAIDDSHPHAAFHLAYLLDLHGNDERSMDLYLQCTQCPFVHVNALINLAIAYEDNGEYERAARCLRRVLAVQPNHARAQLYLKDVMAARDMYIDEHQLRQQEKHDAVLDIPVTDFELSVRSRNCLKKMNINTLGDLLRISEAELLAYKNFGETSLREIKAMLTQKGLALGQNAHQRTDAPMVNPAEAAAITGASPELLARPVVTMELSVRSRKCLQRLGIITIGDLIMRTETELLESRNFGQTSLSEIKSRLSEMGISLRIVGA